MYAKFHADGKLEILNDRGDVITSDIPDAKKGDFSADPIMNYAVSLMKHKGDWPGRPWQGQTVELGD